MNSPEENEGSLERLGVQVQTVIEEDILTEAQALKVRFRATKVKGYSNPVGYAFSEVDTFVRNIVTPSLAWYQNALHERDKTVHRLGEELDRLQVDNTNLTKQLEYIQYNSRISDGIQAGQDDQEMSALLSRLQEQQETIDSLRASGDGSTPSIGSVDVNEYVSAIEERDTYIKQITEQYNELLSTQAEIVVPLAVVDNEEVDRLNSVTETLRNELDAKKEQYDSLLEERNALQQKIDTTPVPVSDGNNEDTSRVVELEEYIGSVTEQYNQLLEQYNILQTQVASSEDTTRVVELEEYIGSVTEQYNQLLEQYNTVQTQLENNVPSTNNAELGLLKVELEAEKAKNVRLEEQLEEALQNDEDDDIDKSENTPLPLLSEMREEDIKLPSCIDLSSLPPGIKPSDL
jgi:hypothetical protein